MNAIGTQKKQFNKLKHDLEGFREIVLLLSSVLKWEKKFYPGVIFGAISFLFLILWWLDLSLLTLVSVIGLIVILTDYGFPIVSKVIFKPENWTGVQEKAYEEVCEELSTVKVKVCGLTKHLCVPKEEKTIVVSIDMICSAVCGCVALFCYHGNSNRLCRVAHYIQLT